MNATSAPNPNAIPQSSVMPNQQSNPITQSYVTQTLPLSQSLTTPHNHSVYNIPENTTLPMLNPWQKQSIFERKNFPQNRGNVWKTDIFTKLLFQLKSMFWETDKISLKLTPLSDKLTLNFINNFRVLYSQNQANIPTSLLRLTITITET